MDYRLKPLGTTCAATGEPLLPGETVISTAVASEQGDESVERVDYSTAGWATVEETAGSKSIAIWQATVPVPAAKKPGLDPDEQMLRFEQLAEEDAPHQADLVYVLALWLVRKRRLKIGETEEIDSVSRLKIVGTHGEGSFAIRDRYLSLNDIEAIQHALFEPDTSEQETATAHSHDEPTSENEVAA